MAFKIYYGDGSEFDGASGPLTAAPAVDVQVIAEDGDIVVGRRLLARQDYYWYEDGRWWGGDLFGLYDFLQRSGVVKFGRTIPRERFEPIMARAMTDPALDAKTAGGPEDRGV